MKRKTILILSLISILPVALLSAQENENPSSQESASEPGKNSAEAFAIIPNLEPEESSDLDPYHTKATFKTNVKNAKIFLNGNFQGVSKLSVLNFIEGFYLLRAEKDGYNFKENFVYIERGKAKTFYIELTPEQKDEIKTDSVTEDKTEQSQEAIGDLQ